MVAAAKSVIFGYLIFFLSSSACAHKISLSKLDNLGLVNSWFSILKIAAFNSLAIWKNRMFHNQIGVKLPHLKLKNTD